MEPEYVELDPQIDIFFKTLPAKNSVSILKIRNITEMKIAYKVISIQQIYLIC